MKNITKNIIILILCLLFGGLVSLVLRMYPNYDFFAYHYYNGWAFLNNRINIDILPVSFRTYFNPIIDSINYLLITKLNSYPDLFYFIQGFRLGLFLFLSYIFTGLLSIENKTDKRVITFFYMVLVFFTPLLILNISWENNDILISCFALLAFYIYVKNIFNDYAQKQQIFLFLSAFIIGSASGLKYTASIYCLAMLICTLINFNKIKCPIKTLINIFLGMFAGFLLMNGWWMYILYKNFGNPLFPYFDNIFSSKYGNGSMVLDYDFAHIRPRGWFDFVISPFKSTMSRSVGSESIFYDLKTQLVSVLIVSYFAIFKNKVQNILNKIINPDIFNMCIIYTATAYYINLLVFGQLRYFLFYAPLCSLVITVLLYVYSYAIQDNKVFNKLFVKILLGLSVIFYCLVNNVENKIVNPFLFVVLSVIVFYVYVYYYSRLSSFQKRYYYCLTLIFLLFAGTLFIPPYSTKKNQHTDIKGLMVVEDAKIKDNALVFCSTLVSCSIAPNQNPKAKYVRYALQDDYAVVNRFKKHPTRVEYNSPYLQEKVLETYNEATDVYFMYATQDINSNKQNMLEAYQSSIYDYFGIEVDLFNNCEEIKYSIDKRFINIYKFMICKIK